MIRDALADAVRTTLAGLDIGEVPTTVVLERPARAEHGDWSTNVAMAMAKTAGRKPRDLAQELADRLSQSPPPHVEAVEVAGPGFVNFRLRDSWLHEVLGDVVRSGEAGYATHGQGGGEKVQIEFVSANPTGPLHVGNGWWCAYGDALARVLTRCGDRVEREYYVNDTGGQIRTLGESLLARRRGDDVPEGGYQGASVTELAVRYDGPDDVTEAGRWAAEQNLADIRLTLASIGIEFDQWYSQASIEESEAVADTVAFLADRGLVFTEEGATWLRTAAFGDPREQRVLRKSNGDYTYLAGDIAYHRDKFLIRGFGRVIDVWGADHHGQVASLQAGVQALGVEAGRLEVELGQMISLASGRMSKRLGNAVPLAELIAEIGPDATRFLSLMSSIDQPTTVDLELVKQQTMDNPVYYVQYANVRLHSITRVAAERGVQRDPFDTVDVSVLMHPRELEVLRRLSELPDVVAGAAADRAPHRVTTWVRTLAADVHGFHHDCRVLPGDREDIAPALTQARLWLAEAARIGLAIALDLLGVSAPERM